MSLDPWTKWRACKLHDQRTRAHDSGCHRTNGFKWTSNPLYCLPGFWSWWALLDDFDLCGIHFSIALLVLSIPRYSVPFCAWSLAFKLFAWSLCCAVFIAYKILLYQCLVLFCKLYLDLVYISAACVCMRWQGLSNYFNVLVLIFRAYYRWPCAGTNTKKFGFSKVVGLKD